MKFTNNFRLLVSLKLEVFLAHLVVGFVIFTVLHLFPWRFHQICRERAARFRNDISYVFPCTVISVNMPTPHFYRKYAHPFSEGSFLKILW